MKMDTNDITWYEDGNSIEFYPDGTLENRVYVECDLKDAIEFAWKNKMCLYIQPESQNAGLFVDYGE